MKTANVNPETGIRYGYIAGNSIDPEIIDAVFRYGTDLSFLDFREECESMIRTELEDSELSDEARIAEFDTRLDAALEGYCMEEPVVAATLDGVEVRTSWLGGALNLWIFHSPTVGQHALCSPCVPNAGDLDSLGEYDCYDVPADWRDNVCQ